MTRTGFDKSIFCDNIITMSRFVRSALLLLLCLVTGMHTAHALTAEVRRTHSVFYRGLARQALLQIKIEAHQGEVLRSISFNTGKTKKISDIRAARLYTSKGSHGFAPTAEGDGIQAVELASLKTILPEFKFEKKVELQEGQNHFWLVLDIATNAGANNIIDAECVSIETNDGSVTPQKIICEALKKERYARVYPFTYRVVPYYRPRWVKGWGNAPEAVHLTPQHFELMTDLIHFAYTVTNDGQVGLQWVGEGADATECVNGALKEIRRLRKASNGKAKLIAGFGHMDGPMTAVVANRELRRALARNMAKWAIKRGYNGIDIDWEYPDTHEQWHHFALFLADLREELAGSDLSISMASSVTYKVPIRYTTDQLDFIMTMSYDDTAAEHSSMWRFCNDANKCLNDFRMPRQRIVIGLPFYSNQKGTLTQQFGYSTIRSWYPRLKPNVNECISKNADGSNGPVHTFNGPDLIREKCRWMKKEKFGGVMIWAYDTDVPLKDKASLGRAMYSVVRQPKAKTN